MATGAPERIRSISRSPACHGWSTTLHVWDAAAVAPPASDNATDPSKAMKSSACPVSDAAELSTSVRLPLSHFRVWSAVLTPPTLNAVGFNTPFVPSAPTAVPMATGSKNASCRVPVGRGDSDEHLDPLHLFFGVGVADNVFLRAFAVVELVRSRG